MSVGSRVNCLNYFMSFETHSWYYIVQIVNYCFCLKSVLLGFACTGDDFFDGKVALIVDSSAVLR